MISDKSVEELNSWARHHADYAVPDYGHDRPEAAAWLHIGEALNAIRRSDSLKLYRIECQLELLSDELGRWIRRQRSFKGWADK